MKIRTAVIYAIFVTVISALISFSFFSQVKQDKTGTAKKNTREKVSTNQEFASILSKYNNFSNYQVDMTSNGRSVMWKKDDKVAIQDIYGKGGGIKFYFDLTGKKAYELAIGKPTLVDFNEFWSKVEWNPHNIAVSLKENDKSNEIEIIDGEKTWIYKGKFASGKNFTAWIAENFGLPLKVETESPLGKVINFKYIRLGEVLDHEITPPGIKY